MQAVAQAEGTHKLGRACHVAGELASRFGAGMDSVQLPEERAVRHWRAFTVAGHMQPHPRL